jgi:hypothetical protein
LCLFVVLLSDRAFRHCWPDLCLSLLEVFNLFLQEWAFMLSLRVFEFEIPWTVIDESSSFMEFKVLKVTPISYFKISSR